MEVRQDEAGPQDEVGTVRCVVHRPAGAGLDRVGAVMVVDEMILAAREVAKVDARLKADATTSS